MDLENNLKNFSYNSSEEQLSLFLNLDGFEGPIDLLLHLSREQKVDLSSISISELASQYISFVEEIKILNIEIAADYLVMAAWLAYLKSKILIPDQHDDESSENLEEISAELKIRLLRLEAMQKASESLIGLPKLGESRYSRGENFFHEDKIKYEYETNLFQLLSAYGQINNKPNNTELTIETSKLYSVKEASERIINLIKNYTEWVDLKDLLPEMQKITINDNNALASHFLASLEMANKGELKIRQENPFGTIWMKNNLNN